MREARAVELAARVVRVGGDRHPAVLVDVEDALAVDVALARLQRRLDDPDAMQLPAHHVGIHVLRRGDVGRLRAVGELVVAVRNDHLLLADELEVEAVHRAVEHASASS